MSLRPWLPLLPLLLYLAHAASYGSWIVDDAAISFAYARDLASGHGLVSQPGMAPVEGYSNPLWTWLLALCMWLHAFAPVWTPKLLSAALVAVGGLGIARACREAWLSTLALSLTALNPSFVIWTISGLENGLLVALVGTLAALLVRALRADDTPATAVLAGAAAAALAMTRPDGALWLLAFPAALCWRQANPTTRGRLVLYTAASGALLAAFLLHRYMTFGELLPNTFHAKQAGLSWRLPLTVLGAPLLLSAARAAGPLLHQPTVRRRAIAIALFVAAAIPLLILTGARDLLRTAFGHGQLVLGAALLLLLAWVRAPSPAARAAVLCTALGAMQYLALPRDWMGYLRFGTAFLLFVPLWLLLWLDDLGWLATHRRRALAAAVLAAVTLPNDLRQWLHFRADPTLPVQAIWREQQQTFERYAARLGGERSLLTEDIGAPLYFGSLRIFDLGGLAERRIGRTIFRDPRALADHVFDELRPDFVRLRRYIARHSALTDDPRLLRDYAAIWQRQAPRENNGSGPLVPVGDYVRRDRLQDPEQFEALQAMVRDLPVEQWLLPVPK